MISLTFARRLEFVDCIDRCNATSRDAAIIVGPAILTRSHLAISSKEVERVAHNSTKVIRSNEIYHAVFSRGFLHDTMTNLRRLHRLLDVCCKLRSLEAVDNIHVYQFHQSKGSRHDRSQSIHCAVRAGGIEE